MFKLAYSKNQSETAEARKKTPAGRQAERERSEANALAEIEKEARLRREKSERLRKLRLARDAAE